MELQGVKILRISDLKRFFKLDEFWKQKDDFVKLAERSVFFDTADEKEIFNVLRSWLMNDSEINAKLMGDNALIGGLTKDEKKPLGRLSKEITDYQGKIRNKDLIGLTLIYLMLGAEALDSDIDLEYNFFFKTGNCLDNCINGVVFCQEDVELDELSLPRTPIERIVIANNNNDGFTKDLVVRKGAQMVTLKPSDCVVGIFHEKRCLKLLPNRLTDSEHGITLQLKMDFHSKNPFLEIHSKGNDIKRIDGVLKFNIEVRKGRSGIGVQEPCKAASPFPEVLS